MKTPFRTELTKHAGRQFTDDETGELCQIVEAHHSGFYGSWGSWTEAYSATVKVLGTGDTWSGYPLNETCEGNLCVCGHSHEEYECPEPNEPCGNIECCTN